MKTLKNPNLLTVKKAAELLNVSTDTLRLWDEKNILTPVRGDNGYRYYTQVQISEFLKNNEVKPRNKRPLLYIRYIDEKDKEKQLSVLTKYVKNTGLYKYNTLITTTFDPQSEAEEITKLLDIIMGGKVDHIITESEYIISPNSFKIIKHIADIKGCEITTLL